MSGQVNSGSKNKTVYIPKGDDGQRVKVLKKKTIHLKNRQGRQLTVTLREYHPGDEPGIIACIRDEYADTYFKQNFYRPEYLYKEAQSGHITFLVAQTQQEEIAGIMILKEFLPEESMCEIASQIFRKKYRGYGLAMPFFEYGMDILLSRNYSAAYCLPVLFHDTTQRLLYRLRLRATGFILNVFDMEHVRHSYKRCRNTKHSQGIQIRSVGKKDAGTVYIPREHQAFCREIYESLGVAYCMAKTDRFLRGGHDKKNLLSVSDLSYRQDKIQSSLEINVHQVGNDLAERIADIHKEFPVKGRQTVNVFLNINDRNSVWAYRVLTDRGYFFTGLKPLCSENEYMVLHNPGDVEIYFEDYVLSGEFMRLLTYVKSCYTIRQ